MAKIGRPGLSPGQKAELWERWKGGPCASDIAGALARTKGAIHRVLALNGGIAPVARRRGPVALVLDEREEISRGIAAGRSSQKCSHFFIVNGNRVFQRHRSEAVGGRSARKRTLADIFATRPVA